MGRVRGSHVREASSSIGCMDRALGEHSDIGRSAVIAHADTPELRDRVRQAVEKSLDMWWLFFDEIERAIP